MLHWLHIVLSIYGKILTILILFLKFRLIYEDVICKVNLKDLFVLTDQM